MSAKTCMNGSNCRYLHTPNPKTGLLCPFAHTSGPVATSAPVDPGYAEYLRKKAEDEAKARAQAQAQADPGYAEYLRQKAQAQQVPAPVPAQKTHAQPAQGHGKGKKDGDQKPNPKAGHPGETCRHGTEADCPHFQREGKNGCNRTHRPAPTAGASAQPPAQASGGAKNHPQASGGAKNAPCDFATATKVLTTLLTSVEVGLAIAKGNHELVTDKGALERVLAMLAKEMKN